MTRAAQRTTLRIPHAGLAPLFFALLIGLLPRPAAANTTVFTNTATCTITGHLCKALSQFGVLTSTSSDTLSINGGWTFGGGIGVGTTDKLSKSGTNTANGIVDFSDAVTSGTSCTTNNFCGGGTWSGTQPVRNQTAVTSAESQLSTIMTALNGSTFNTGNGTTTSLSTTGTLNIQAGLSGNLKVFRNASGFTQTGAITLGCGGSMCNANDLVVIKVTGGNVSLNNSITLADGLGADQVVWYIPSNNLSINPTQNGKTISGDFFAGSTSGTYTWGGTGGSSKSFALYGRMFALDGAITFNNKGGTQTDDGAVPEPGTWAMMAGGLGIAIWLRRRRKLATRKEAA